MRRTFVLLTVLSFSVLSVGCGGGESSDTGTTAATPSATQAAPSAPTGTATITGTVNFTGTAPDARRIRLDADCQALHSEPVFSEKVLVNDNGTLKNVFVYVKEGLGDQTFAAPAEPVVFDQHGCHYAPHVLGVQVGQTFKILNSDPFLHNINVQAEQNRGFNFGMPKQGDERERDFRVPEVMVHIKCDVHPWMEAYVGVVPHPFFGTTGDDGSFSLNNLPAGTYVIEAWHEEYGTATQTVTVTDGASASADFTFGAAS